MLLENELALCIADAYPVSEGHSLVVPRRRVADGLELHQLEWNAVVELLRLRREQLNDQDATISGWAGLLNARGDLNSDEAAGQTVFQAHWHLIPRRTGNDKSPRGGVRRGGGGGIKGNSTTEPWPARWSCGCRGLGRHSHTRSRVGCSRFTPTPEGIPARAPSYRAAQNQTWPWSPAAANFVQ